MRARWVIGLAAVSLLAGVGSQSSARASWPGTNGEIVSLNGSSTVDIAKITTYDPATQTVETVVDAASVVRRNVVWSPDGHRLAWAETDGDRTDLRIREDDGTVRWLTTGASVRTPNWTPDGRRLIFICGIDVCEINADGTGLKTLLTSDLVIWNDVSLSPDGTRIAFRNERGLQIARLDDPTKVDQVAILSDSGCPGQFKVAWSPDQSTLAWCDDFKLQTVRVNATGLRTVATDDYGNPTWSPDGTTLAYPTAPSAPYGFHLTTVAADGTDEQPLLDDAGHPVYGDDPDWALAHSSTATPNPPAVTGRPAIIGNAVIGDSLGVDEGVWNGDPPLTFTYQWQRCDTDGENCAEIAGATRETYTVTAADGGTRLRVAVTATNYAGSATSGSDATGVIPVQDQAPTIRTVTASVAGRTVRTKLTTCDDAAGRLTASLRMWTLRHGKRTGTANRTWSWRSAPGCHTTTHAAKAPQPGGARYGTIRVRDGQGAWSRAVRLTLR